MTEEISFKDIAEERRSVAFFDSEKELDDNLLENIIDLAVLAPSSFNTQPWKIIAVKSKGKREELYEKACNQKKVLKAPVTLIILGDRDGYKRDKPIWKEKLVLNKITEDKIENVIAHNDNKLYNTEGRKISYAIRNSSLLAMSIMYSAKYYGVDTHPMIGFDQKATRELFDISDNYEIAMMISAGYFDDDKELDPRETRFKYDHIVDEY